MIEPYETALPNASQGFSKLGFSIVRNDEYAATFSNGTYSIELSTDRYYHPELCGVICHPTGKKFEIGLVRQILETRRVAGRMSLPRKRSDSDLAWMNAGHHARCDWKVSQNMRE
jgi:hypothetical protein